MQIQEVLSRLGLMEILELNPQEPICNKEMNRNEVPVRLQEPIHNKEKAYKEMKANEEVQVTEEAE